MKIYVVRHGLTELNKQKKVNGEIDEPLAQEGIEQAKEAISTLPDSITHIYTSPLLRARQTAEIIGSALKIPAFPVKELTEIHMGTLAGKSWEEMESGLELKEKHRSVQFDYQPFGGESVKDVHKRLVKFLKKINGKHIDDQVLIITHGGIIRFFHLLDSGEVPYETEKHISLLEFDLKKILNQARVETRFKHSLRFATV